MEKRRNQGAVHYELGCSDFILIDTSFLYEMVFYMLLFKKLLEYRFIEIRS